MNIFIKLLFVLILVLNLVFQGNAAFALEMKIYCFGDKQNISAPFPGQPKSLAGKYKQTFMYEDVNYYNQYQFFFNDVEYMPKGVEYHLNSIAQVRVKSLNGQIVNINFVKTTTGGRLRYLYSYKKNGIEIDSSVVTEISGNDYYSWSVQSFRGHSPYNSEQIVNQYINYFGKNRAHCK